MKTLPQFVFVLFILTKVVAADEATCYSVQLFSSHAPFKRELKALPKSCVPMKISGIYTVRCGCDDVFNKTKKRWKRLRKKYRSAVIVSSYRFRFANKKREKIETNAMDVSDALDRLMALSLPLKSNASPVKPLPCSRNSQGLDTPKFEGAFCDKDLSIDDRIESSKVFYHFYLDISGRVLYTQALPGMVRSHGNGISARLGMRVYYPFAKTWSLYLEPRVGWRYYHTDDDTIRDVNFDFREFYLKSQDLFNDKLNFILGRKVLRDSRSWYTNSSVDTVGIFNRHDLLLYSLYFGGRLNDEKIYSEEDNTFGLSNTRFVLGHLRYEFYKQNYWQFFAIYEKTLGVRKLGWLGSRVNGNIYLNDLQGRYWFDFARMGGRIEHVNLKNNVDGWATDLGAALAMKDWPVSLLVDYAVGSGSHDGRNGFYSPYLTNNRSDFLTDGVWYNYYGELLRPELTNLQIYTLGTVLSLFHTHKGALILHKYTQNKTGKQFRSRSGYLFAPDGLSDDIGTEVDLIYGYILPNHNKLKAIFSYFKGGDAYDGMTRQDDAFYFYINYRHYW